MSTLANQSTGYQTLTLDQMHESSTNPRRTFEPNKLAELAAFVAGHKSGSRLVSDGFNPCAVVETSAGNFQAWLKHPAVLLKLIGTFAAQTLAERYDADPTAADWRRFGRLPGFTNCKPTYRKSDGLFCSAQGSQRRTVSDGQDLTEEITKLYQGENRSGRRDAYTLPFLPNGDRGYRICLWSNSAPPPSTWTGLPPRT